MSIYTSFIFLFLLTFFTSFPASAQVFFQRNLCSTTNFSRNSTYFTNLRTLLSILSSSNASYSTGFQNATVGQPPDRITGFFLCRGDRSPENCRSCVSYSVNQSLILCANRKSAQIFYEECILVYSHKDILSTVVYEGGYILMSTYNDSSNQAARFEGFVSSTLYQAANEAANNSRKFFTKKATWDATQSLYVLVQCTPDLTRIDCFNCLRDTINEMPLYRIGGRFFWPRCNSRYELYPFYNEPAVRPPDSTSPLSSPPPRAPLSSPPPRAGNTGKGRNSTVIIIAVVVPVTAILLLLLAVFRVRAKKSRTIYETEPLAADGEDITTSGSITK